MEQKFFNVETVEHSVVLASRLLKLLGNEKRLTILCKLYEGEKSVTELVALLGLSQSALSQHLACLRKMEVVTTRREGTTIIYSLADHSAQDVMGVLCQIYKS